MAPRRPGRPRRNRRLDHAATSRPGRTSTNRANEDSRRPQRPPPTRTRPHQRSKTSAGHPVAKPIRQTPPPIPVRRSPPAGTHAEVRTMCGGFLDGLERKAARGVVLNESGTGYQIQESRVAQGLASQVRPRLRGEVPRPHPRRNAVARNARASTSHRNLASPPQISDQIARTVKAHAAVERACQVRMRQDRIFERRVAVAVQIATKETARLAEICGSIETTAALVGMEPDEVRR